jgi:hypothetical protein
LARVGTKKLQNVQTRHGFRHGCDAPPWTRI